MKRRTMSILRYTAAIAFAFTIGMVLVLAFEADAETDVQMNEIDVFIKRHETTTSYNNNEPETVSLSYAEWKEEQTTQPEIVLEVATAQPETEWIEPEAVVMTAEDFQSAGIIDWNGWRYTYYSEQVLPGGGLDIPGRWSDGQFVRDCDGFLCVASNEHEQGAVVATPFGDAKVYDMIGDGVTGIIDIYVSW